MLAFIVILVAIAIIVYFATKSNSSADKARSKASTPSAQKASASHFTPIPHRPKLKLLDREGDVHDDEWHTYIAGALHHVGSKDVGGFLGYVMNDAANKYDPKAMGVYSSTKLLGYIPSKELAEYREWSEGAPLPCMGFIYIEEGQLRGRVKIVKPCNEDFLKEEFLRYGQWVLENKGQKYLPTGTVDYTFE